MRQTAASGWDLCIHKLSLGGKLGKSIELQKIMTMRVKQIKDNNGQNTAKNDGIYYLYPVRLVVLLIHLNQASNAFIHGMHDLPQQDLLTCNHD